MAMHARKEDATKEQFDEVPFDVVEESDEALEMFQIQPLRDFIGTISPGDLTLDLGCGTGRTTVYLKRRGLRVVGLELSLGSLQTIRTRHTVPLVQGSNLALPFDTESADIVVSDGVIPYTDDPYLALAETLRTLKSKGRAIVVVYKRSHYYYYIYSYVGGTLRTIARLPLGAWLLDMTVLPLYHLARNMARPGRKSSFQKSRSLFYSYFMSPTIRFFTREQVEDWAKSLGARCMLYEPCPGWSAQAFVLEKS